MYVVFSCRIRSTSAPLTRSQSCFLQRPLIHFPVLGNALDYWSPSAITCGRREERWGVTSTNPQMWATENDAQAGRDFLRLLHCRFAL